MSVSSVWLLLVQEKRDIAVCVCVCVCERERERESEWLG